MKDFIPAIFFWGGGGERWHDNECVPITFDQDCSVRELLLSFCAMMMYLHFFRSDTVHKRAVDAVCATYKTLYDAIVNDSNKYPDVKTLVPRTPDQVTSLLT